MRAASRGVGRKGGLRDLEEEDVEEEEGDSLKDFPLEEDSMGDAIFVRARDVLEADEETIVVEARGGGERERENNTV